MAEDLRRQIQWMEQELLSEEYADTVDTPAQSGSADPDRAMYADEYYGPAGSGKPKNPKHRALRYLVLLGILAVIGWWLKCQM